MSLIILGIDPGTVNTGYGLIKISSKGVNCLDYGVLHSSEKNFSLRVQSMYQDILELCQNHHPNHLAIEKVFFGKNPDTAFKLGHIFAICLLISKQEGVEFFEYASRFVKKSVSFSGNASKQMLSQFVKNFLSLPNQQKAPLDATDALAVALCHSRQLRGLEQRQTSLKEKTLR